MARAALGWGVRELAKKAGVSPTTVNAIELGANSRISTLHAIQSALEKGKRYFPSRGRSGRRRKATEAAPTMMVTPVQMIMARAALQWGVRELDKKSGITANTISRIENGCGARVSTLVKIQRAFERAGIVLILENDGGGVGVRLRKDARLAYSAKRKFRGWSRHTHAAHRGDRW